MKNLSKQHKLDLIQSKADYLSRMQKPLGHHSWWYTNRSSKDCIDVKIYASVDIDAVLALLTERERLQIETLGLDVAEICQDVVWGEVGWIDTARYHLLDTLQCDVSHRILSVEFGGRSGGWLCVVYDFDELDTQIEDLLNADNPTTKLVDTTYKAVLEALDIIQRTEIKVMDMKQSLIADIKNPAAGYVDEIQSRIEDAIGFFEREHADIAHKLAVLAK